MKKLKALSLLVLLTVLFGNIISLNAQTNMKADHSLSSKELSLVPIAGFTAKGDMPQLRTALNSGLDAGVTVNEIKEVLVQLYAYTGFPRALNALGSFRTVLEERKKNGKKDLEGQPYTASVTSVNENRLKKGTAIQAKLLGSDMKTSTADFAPIIDIFLKEHLFADIFGRDVLDFKTREIVTIAALASLGGAEPQLRSHINVGIYNGLTKDQLYSISEQLKDKIGPAESSSMKEILKNIYMKDNENPKSRLNPFTLVYDGAITENIEGKVNIHPISYKIKDITIEANIYTPPNYNSAAKYPAIVIAHPNGGVKEQVAGLYAQHLAEQGYITITADAAYQGASGGFPRNVDKPANRIEDIYAMADYISGYAGVDSKRLGLLGICGGGGYSLKAAQSDKRFKSVATLSMFNSGVVRRNGYMNSQLSTIQDRLKQASDARAQEAAGGEILYANNGAPMTKEQIAAIPVDLYRQGIEYYTITYAHPNSSAKYTVSSLLDLMTWDASTNMDLIEQPLLMIAGSKADSYYMTEDAFGKAVNAKNKELFLIEGATHIETYWKPEYVRQAVDKLTQFYTKFL